MDLLAGSFLFFFCSPYFSLYLFKTFVQKLLFSLKILSFIFILYSGTGSGWIFGEFFCLIFLFGCLVGFFSMCYMVWVGLGWVFFSEFKELFHPSESAAKF